MRNFIKYLGTLIGTPIRLYFCSPHTSELDTESYTWLGKIVKLEESEIDGGLIIFEHVPEDSFRLQAKTSGLNLSTCVIWGVDVLSDGFDTSAYLDCPHCKKPIKLSSTKLNNRGEDEVSEKTNVPETVVAPIPT